MGNVLSSILKDGHLFGNEKADAGVLRVIKLSVTLTDHRKTIISYFPRFYGLTGLNWAKFVLHKGRLKSVMQVHSAERLAGARMFSTSLSMWLPIIQ